MKEADLYAPICDGAAKDGFRLFKIEDGGRMKKPFDIVGIAPDGRSVGVEVKVIRETIRLERSLCANAFFESQQVEWLNEWVRSGGIPLVLLYEEPESQLWAFKLKATWQWENPLESLLPIVLQRVEGVFRGWRWSL